MTDFEKLAIAMLLAIASGAAGGILSTRTAESRRRKRLARQVSVAFWEELNATAFQESKMGANASIWTYGGFSSQTFDTQFADVADVLPNRLARDVMRYHWRMKMFEDSGQRQHTGSFIEEVVALHQKLIGTLDDYVNGRDVE